MTNQDYNSSFTKPIIKYGRLTNLLAIPLCFLPCLAVWFIYGVVPPVQDILKGWGLIASIFAIYAVVEPISYFPVVGVPGTYMVCLSGNISNVRVPCSAIAQEAIGVEIGTQKAEIVSTLGIAGSIITNMVVVTIAAVGGSALMSLFPPAILEAFKYVASAIFGAIFAMYAVKRVEYGIFALVLILPLLLFTKIPAFLLIPIAVFSTVAFAFFEDSRKRKKENN